jgi:hypothetical protein
MNEALRKVTREAIMEAGTITGAADAIGMKQAAFSRKLHSDAFFSIDQFMGICAYAKTTADELYKRAVGTKEAQN